MPKKKKITNTISRIEDPILIQTALEVARNEARQKNLSEKIEKAPQTFIEDTFQIGSENNDVPIIIKNEIKKKHKNIIEAHKLSELFTFKNKLNKIKTRVEYEKSFAFLFDFVNSSKLYRTYYTNEIDDEYDLLLYHSVIGFKKKMAILQLKYVIYQKFEIYFDSLKSLYGRFKTADNTEKLALNKELKQMLDMSEEIAFYYFK